MAPAKPTKQQQPQRNSDGGGAKAAAAAAAKRKHHIDDSDSEDDQVLASRKPAAAAKKPTANGNTPAAKPSKPAAAAAKKPAAAAAKPAAKPAARPAAKPAAAGEKKPRERKEFDLPGQTRETPDEVSNSTAVHADASDVLTLHTHHVCRTLASSSAQTGAPASLTAAHGGLLHHVTRPSEQKTAKHNDDQLGCSVLLARTSCMSIKPVGLLGLQCAD